MNEGDAKEAGLGIGAVVSGGAGLLASLVPGEAAVWVERIGLPAAILLAIGWAVVRLARWVGARVAEPMVASHVAMVETLKATQVRNAESLERIAEAHAKSAQADGATLEVVRELRGSVEEERRTSRLAVEGVQAAIDRLAAAVGSTPPNGTASPS